MSTFTLCTIPDPRSPCSSSSFLKPGGKLFYADHGLSTDPKVQKWQHRLNGLQNVVCGGCNMNRDIRGLITKAGFALDQVDQYYMKGAPKFAGFMTRGIANALAYPALGYGVGPG